MTAAEIREAQVWLDANALHLVDIEARNLVATARFDLAVMARAADGADIPDLARYEAEHAKCRAALEARIVRQPPPTKLPAHLYTGEFLPVVRPLRHTVPRVLRWRDPFERRHGR